MTVMTSVKADTADLLQVAEELALVARAHAQEIDTQRRIPDPVISAFREAGLFSAMRPVEAGGAGISLSTFVDITRIISRGDASAGWVAAFLISHNWLLSRLNAEAQHEIFTDGEGLAAATAAPPGKAEPVEGGYRVTGRWRFASAILHSNWAIVSAGGASGPLAVIAKISEGEIHDVWNVPGMRGTGSNDFALDNAFIPAHRVVDFIKYSSRQSDGVELYPNYDALQYPMFRVLSLIHGAVGVGTAEAALELFPVAMDKRVRPQTGQPLITEPGTFSAYGEAYQQAMVARLLLDDAVARTEHLYRPGSAEPSVEDRARLNLAVTGSGVEAAKAIDIIVQNAGASIQRTGHPLELICRNNQVMRNHVTLDWRYVQSLAGRVLLGQGLGAHLDALY